MLPLRSCLIGALLGAVLALPSLHAGKPAVQPPAASGPLTIEELCRPASLGHAALSPNGRHLAAIVTDEKEIRHLAIYDVATLKPAFIRAGNSYDIYTFGWLNDDRLVFNTSKDKTYAYGLFAVDRRKMRNTIPLNLRDVTRIVGAPLSRPDHLLVWIRKSADFEGDDGGFVEIDTKKSAISDWQNIDSTTYFEKIFLPPENKGPVVSWITDFDGDLAACVTYFNRRYRMHRYQKNTGAWQELPLNRDNVSCLRIDPDGEHLWIVDYDKDKGSQLRRYDMTTHALDEPIASDNAYGLASARLYFSRKTRTLAGFSYEQRRQKTVWFSDDFASAQKSADLAFPDWDNVLVDFDDTDNVFLFRGTSAQQPGIYLLVDLNAATVQPVSYAAPWLKDRPLQPCSPMTFKTRDGVRLEGYLTLPVGASKANPVPMVVLAHGGPWVRDNWTFDADVQFLASRGYAVLQPNYRGSSGYSWAISREDTYNFRRMHDDVTDATRAVLRSGLIDPKRLAIMGGSFGGYLALTGVSFEKDLYRCAVSICGVFDWAELIRDAKNDGQPGEYQRLIDRLGDPTEDKARFEEISPLMHVDAITVPVLIAHGEYDTIVSVTQSKKLAAALKQRGIPHETFFRPLEGHGFYSYKNRVEYYHVLERFLAKYLAPPPASPEAAPAPGVPVASP